jgi:hypothetical protein
MGLKAFGAVVLLCLFGSSIWGQISIMPVVLNGDAAPGGGGFSEISHQDFLLNSEGQLVFMGQAAEGPDVSIGIWSYSGANGQLVARSANGFGGLAVGSGGHIALIGYDESGTGSVWAGPVGDLQLVAREGAPAPGTNPPRDFGTAFGVLAINRSGTVLFHELDAARTSTRSIWTGRSGSVQLIAMDGDAAPGTSTTFFQVAPAVLSDSGKVAFYGLLDPFTFQTGGPTGIWTGAAGSVQQLAAAGFEAPGMGGLKWDYGGFQPPSINSSGVVVFHGSLENTAEGIWIGTPGDLRLVIRDGQAAPGTDSTFTRSSYAVINDHEQIAFRASVNGHPGMGTWAGAVDDLKLVLMEETPAPAAPGQIIGSVWDYKLNNNGQVALTVTLHDSASGAASNAIYATDLTGTLHLLVREGDLLDVRGVQRQIEELTVRFNSKFSDDGQLAFWAKFTDGGEGIFIATVPEPAMMGLLLGALLMIGRPRRRLSR